MTEESKKYLYKIHVDSAADLVKLSQAAARCPYDVTLVSGRHRLNAKSLLGVILAKLSWEDIYVETDTDCYFELEQFIQ